jgi:hypothetical protein
MKAKSMVGRRAGYSERRSRHAAVPRVGDDWRNVIVPNGRRPSDNGFRAAARRRDECQPEKALLTRHRFRWVATLALPAAAACVLSGCPAKDERGLDFAKTQRQALDKAKGLEGAVQDAAARRADGADKP